MRATWPWYAATLAGAYGLKRHYATASADELRWVLDPTAWLVTCATGAGSVFESGVGHLFAELRFILAPECAGVNFLIVAASSLVFAFAPACRSALGVLALVALAYLATLAANALRVVALVALDPGPAAHRALGVALYLAALLALHAATRRTLEPRCSARPSSGT